MYSDRDIFSTDCCRHVEFDLQIERQFEKKEYVVISCNKFKEVFRMVK
jgi:hypothetical protein